VRWRWLGPIALICFAATDVGFVAARSSQKISSVIAAQVSSYGDVSASFAGHRGESDAETMAQRSVDVATRAQATLYDMPVSNNGARARMIIYAKGLDSAGKVSIEKPSELGGLKSEQYMSLNPQGKMPLLVVESGEGRFPIYESDTIARYLLEAYPEGPMFRPTSTPEARALDDLITRVHDIYIVSLQSCMYRAVPPFGAFQSRLEALDELKRQLKVIDDLVDDEGPFLTGREIALSDASLFPTLIFIQESLPRFVEEGSDWTSQQNEILGPKLRRWWQHMRSGAVPAADRIWTEISGAFQGWADSGRWDPILYAGRRDTAEATIFDKIISKEIPSDIVYEDDRCLVFKDINPVAPVHLLVIPKRREGLTQLRNANEENEYMLGHLLRVAGEQGKAAVGDGGFRIVINDGRQAAQTVFHLHIHVIGGRDLTWPPG